MTQTKVDVVIIGSGIGGSSVAAILARQGLKIAMVDTAVHPRFALGESTIGETTFLMRLLAGVKYPMCSKATSTGMGSGRTRSWGVDR